MARDKASVMVGEHISLAQKFKHKAHRSFMLIRCICHSAHIVASKAAMKRPRYLEDLRNISDYFSQSSKRQAQVSALHEFLHTEKKEDSAAMRDPMARALCVC
ncbi:hypothetical protein HPB48_002878 [Haemaphysalis longicornis]|uniref:Uncharacterized protein n=1 Tax=Haemaphysalis longicornis TaxID=44386 RepID=A0A9J6FWE2_HAELO|nr:hypothetical protein HPB48_002878 [Haemaphysalis longicornis]